MGLLGIKNDVDSLSLWENVGISQKNGRDCICNWHKKMNFWSIKKISKVSPTKVK